MQLINLTHSDLKFFSDDRKYLGLLPSKVKTKEYPAPYVSMKKKKIKSIGNAVIYEPSKEAIINLPPKKRGYYYVIPRDVLVAQRMSELNGELVRKDLLCPHELTKDINGNIIGCVGLITR